MYADAISARLALIKAKNNIFRAVAREISATALVLYFYKIFSSAAP
jgi:hypothetical protein